MDKKTIVSSFAYKFIERLAVKGIGMIISIILARLLAPEAFGQIAIIMVFINLSQTVIQRGFSSALVQKKDASESDYSTVFYISTGIALVMVLLLWILAPAISKFYGDQGLILPLRIYSVSLIFGAFNSVQTARLQKKMRFRPMMICSLIATVLSGALGVGLAYLNAGIWALIVYYFANVVITSIAMIVVEHWFPSLIFSKASAKRLFGFGWKMLVSSLLCSLYSDLRSLIIGKKFSTEDLGYYSKGQQFPNIISHTLDNAIQSVMFPALSHVQSSTSELRAMLKRTVSMGTMVIFPVMVGLALVSESFVRVLLTDKWLPSVVFMQLICFADANISFTSSNLTVVKAMGRSDIYMKLEIVRRLVMLAVLCVSLFCFRSVAAIAVGYLISAWIDVVIITFVTKRLLNYGFWEQMKDCWKVFAAAALMGAGVYVTGLLPINSLAVMCLQILVGVAVYILACAALKIEGFFQAVRLVRGIVCRKKGRG